MKSKKPLRAPLKSWDLFSLSLQRQADKFSKEIEIQILTEYKEKHGWVFDFDKVLNNTNYEALIITNKAQEIQWVNKGFVKMTGYPISFSKGRTPKFLQGEKSSKTALKEIKDNIKKGIHFKSSVINYRKNKAPYNCNIEIYPLRNENGEICHLFALEREVSM